MRICSNDGDCPVIENSTIVKTGKLLHWKERFWGCKWEEVRVILFQDSVLVWGEEGDQPSGGIRISDAPEMFAAGDFVENIPGRKPDWPDCDSSKKAMAIGSRDARKIIWLIAKSESDLCKWVESVASTIPRSPSVSSSPILTRYPLEQPLIPAGQPLPPEGQPGGLEQMPSPPNYIDSEEEDVQEVRYRQTPRKSKHVRPQRGQAVNKEVENMDWNGDHENGKSNGNQTFDMDKVTDERRDSGTGFGTEIIAGGLVGYGLVNGFGTGSASSDHGKQGLKYVVDENNEGNMTHITEKSEDIEQNNNDGGQLRVIKKEDEESFNMLQCLNDSISIEVSNDILNDNNLLHKTDTSKSNRESNVEQKIFQSSSILSKSEDNSSTGNRHLPDKDLALKTSELLAIVKSDVAKELLEQNEETSKTPQNSPENTKLEIEEFSITSAEDTKHSSESRDEHHSKILKTKLKPKVENLGTINEESSKMPKNSPKQMSGYDNCSEISQSNSKPFSEISREQDDPVLNGVKCSTTNEKELILTAENIVKTNEQGSKNVTNHQESDKVPEKSDEVSQAIVVSPAPIRGIDVSQENKVTTKTKEEISTDINAENPPESIDVIPLVPEPSTRSPVPNPVTVAPFVESEKDQQRTSEPKVEVTEDTVVEILKPVSSADKGKVDIKTNTAAGADTVIDEDIELINC